MERRRRDLPTSIYRILLYLSRMAERSDDSRRLMRIERATSIERKELRNHLRNLCDSGHLEAESSGKTGRGGHPIVAYTVTEAGRGLRGDLGRWIDLGVRLGYYPEEFFYLPSDA